MRANPVDLIGGFYRDDALPWSCQDTVNWLPVMAEVSGTRSPSKLSTAPGLKPWQVVGSGPIRGMHDLEGGKFVVSGQTLCRINPNNTVDPIGTIPGVGRVQMTHNQFKTGYQLLVENGQGGGGYVFTSSTGTFAKITDEGYPGSISSDYLDSYLLGVEPQGRYWFHSNLADATDYNTLDRYEAEAAPDRIVGLAVSQFEVVVFGQRTIEFFFNAGGQTGTFQNRRQSITRGCASRHTIQKLDNTLFWLGDDGVVYRMEGYSPRPISTRPLEKAIAKYNWPEAFAEVWEDRGHKVYYLTFPDGLTFGYDVITGLWHRRESYGLSRWRLSHIQKWGSTWYGGDFQNGRIWLIDWDYVLEGDDPLVRRRVSPVAADNQSAMTNPMAELVFDVGRGPETVAISFPNAITINGIPPSTLVGLTYPTFSFTGSGGTAPYTFSIVSGSLPPGLSMSSAGAVTGSATAGGSYRFTVRAYDSKGAWNEGEYSILSVAQKLGLAVPPMVFTGGYESLAAYAPLSAAIPAEDGAFSISPSTSYVVVGQSSSPYLLVYKLNPETSTYTQSLDIDVVPSATVGACDFSPDGRYLALKFSVSGTPRINIYKFEDGIFKLKAFSSLASNGGRASWSPDGRKLAVSTTLSSPDFGFRVFLFDPASDAITGSISPASGQNAQAPEGFGWSADSRYIAEWSNNNLNAWEVMPTVVAFRSSASDAVSSGRGAHFSDDASFIYTVAGSGSSPISVFPFSSGAIGTRTIPTNQPNFALSDSDFSNGYLALARSGPLAGQPSVVVYRCNGLDVGPISTQPTGSNNLDCLAIRWTI
ncbi:putative Ig domain-containing protein [Stenotrophomonas muris]|uniref:putative Ig domain-containing protein n=1 Tax=Stenotrophomonas muris TaxID=2963283 RepID=UPI0039C6B327